MTLSRGLAPAHSGQCYLGGRISTLEDTRALDRFLAGVERRAFRWRSMSPEERQAFRRQLRQRFGGEGQGGPPATPRQHDRPLQQYLGGPAH